jgi:hypothetical protein
VTDEDPFRAAWRTRDARAWAQALAPDIVVHSPVLSSPFRGRDAAAEVYEVLFGVFGDVTITDELSAPGANVYHWRGAIGRRTIEGADLVRFDERRRVSEIRVFIRPLADLAVFAAAAGPALARRRGRARAVVTAVLVAPLRPLLAVADVVAARLTQR